MSRRSRREAEKKKTLRAWAVLVPSIAILCLLVVFGQVNRPQTGADHCPLDDRFAAQVAVLVDPSDALTAVQQRSSLPRLLEALDQVPARAEIRIYSVARIGRDGSAGADLRLCTPPHPDSIGTLEGLWKNRDIARANYERDFTEPLRSRLGDLLGAPSDSVSPIVEAIQAAAVDAFPAGSATVPRELIVVSDMVQHSADLSFFREAPDFGAFGGSPVYRTLRVDLSGVQPTVFLLARRGLPGRLQVGDMEEFWDEYFIDSEADGKPRWVSVEG